MSKITVLLSETEFHRFDTYCEERGFKKSTLIARLVREHLDNECFPEQGALVFEEKVASDTRFGKKL